MCLIGLMSFMKIPLVSPSFDQKEQQNCFGHPHFYSSSAYGGHIALCPPWLSSYIHKSGTLRVKLFVASKFLIGQLIQNCLLVCLVDG